MQVRLTSVWAAALGALALGGVLALAAPTAAAQPQNAPRPAASAVSAVSAASATSAASSAPTPANCPALLQHTVPRLQDEQPQALCQYAGRVLLVVNTASYCGFTDQYTGLEALNAKYAARGLVVMGFPSNDFRQEDADAKKIAALCFNTFGVRFPMFTPISVRGPSAHPLFAQLATATGQAPAWNFNKYLVGRNGVPVAHFGSTVSPSNPQLVAAIERALGVGR